MNQAFSDKLGWSLELLAYVYGLFNGKGKLVLDHSTIILIMTSLSTYPRKSLWLCG